MNTTQRSRVSREEKVRRLMLARLKIVPLTAEDMLEGEAPREFHENPGITNNRNFTFNSVKPCVRWRANGAMQTWKTHPTEFRLPIKYGLRGYYALTHFNINEFHRADTCPVEEELNRIARGE